MPPKAHQGQGPQAGDKRHPDNHGADVSALARQTPRGKDANHGQVVSRAAKTHAPDANPASDDLERS